jgi:hypothetical protein
MSYSFLLSSLRRQGSRTTRDFVGKVSIALNNHLDEIGAGPEQLLKGLLDLKQGDHLRDHRPGPDLLLLEKREADGPVAVQVAVAGLELHLPPYPLDRKAVDLLPGERYEHHPAAPFDKLEGLLKGRPAAGALENHVRPDPGQADDLGDGVFAGRVDGAMGAEFESDPGPGRVRWDLPRGSPPGLRASRSKAAPRGPRW